MYVKTHTIISYLVMRFLSYIILSPIVRLQEKHTDSKNVAIFGFVLFIFFFLNIFVEFPKYLNACSYNQPPLST